MSRHPREHELDLEAIEDRAYDSMKSWGINRYVTSRNSHVGKIWILAFSQWLLTNGYQIVKVGKDVNGDDDAGSKN